MKTAVLFVLISLNASAQFLNFSKSSIISTLKEQNISYVESKTADGFDVVFAKNISQCNIAFVFDLFNTCHTEIITTPSTAVADFIMDLNDINYVEIDGVSYREEKYGLVKVQRDNNTFICQY